MSVDDSWNSNSKTQIERLKKTLTPVDFINGYLSKGRGKIKSMCSSIHFKIMSINIMLLFLLR